MRELVVLSGKGGTGKTSLVGSFAVLAGNKVLADADVDAPDLHLLLQPQVKQEEEFWSGQLAFIDEDKCTQCGLCEELCRFKAIKDYRVDEFSCEGCGFCSQICPVEAIQMRERMAGHWYISETRYGPLVHARLGIAQENSGKLVALVRSKAKALAEESHSDYIITDGPPGIGCPVISSLTGAGLALLVTEPTLSGMHDLSRILGVCQHFGVPALVCINKYDLNKENAGRIEAYCEDMEAKVIGRIPFDNVVTEALAHGAPVVEYAEGRVAREIESLWQEIQRGL